MRSFGMGLVGLVLYLIGYEVTLANAFDVWGWLSDDPRHLLAEIPLLVTYGRRPAQNSAFGRLSLIRTRKYHLV